MEDERRLILSGQVMEDMNSYPEPLGREIEDFLLRLEQNPFSPDLLAKAVRSKDGLYHYQLPSGCFVFWEVLNNVVHPRFGSLEGVTVHVTGARFDSSAR